MAEQERIALFIDGANLYSSSRHLGFDVDYRSMLRFFRDRADGTKPWEAFTPYEMRTIGAFARLGWRERGSPPRSSSRGTPRT